MKNEERTAVFVLFFLLGERKQANKTKFYGARETIRKSLWQCKPTLGSAPRPRGGLSPIYEGQTLRATDARDPVGGGREERGTERERQRERDRECVSQREIEFFLYE
jgi:hypothetical protein